MLPGPTIIKKCSECSGLIEESTIMSGNTFGATFWTDGKREAPMLPDYWWLVTCPHCLAPLWLDEQEQVGEREPWGEDDTFEDARPCQEPSMDAYIRALDNGGSSPEKARYLRFRVWWAGNDPRRATKARTPLSSKEVGNLEALAGLLDSADQNNRLTKAEIMRELGRYHEAAGLLAEPFDEQLSKAAALIGALVQQKTPYVTEMRFDEAA